MSNKLFFICPECNVEAIIKNKYGNDVFFLTALGAVFNFNEVKYAEAVIDLIVREAVTDIYVVNYTSCCFIKNIAKEQNRFETFCENTMQDILIDNYAAIMCQASFGEKKIPGRTDFESPNK